MEFHSMKRKELQALCKKHKIPANLSNLEMAKRLTEFIKENEKSLAPGGPKMVQDENVSETESTNVVMNRKVKKVRFSPEHELIEFTRSVQIKRRSRRNSLSSGNSTLSVENVDSGEMSNEDVDSPCTITGSRGSKLVVSVNEKRGRRGSKRSNQNTNVSATESLNNGELMNAGVDNPGRVMRLRGKTTAEAFVDATKRETKRAKFDDKSGKKALDNIDDDKLIETIVDKRGRLTRSRNKKLTEASSKEMREGKVEKINDNVALASAVNDDTGVVTRRSIRNRSVVNEGKIVKNNDNVALASAVNDDTGVVTTRSIEKNNDNVALASAVNDDTDVVTRRSTRNRSVVNEGKIVKNNEKGSNDKKIEEVHVMVEPQILLRRSKRKVNGVADSEMSNDDTGKHENRATEGFRNIPMPLTVKGSRVDEEKTGSKIDPDLKLEVVLQLEEPIKLEPRRSNRRRSMMPVAELKTENKDRCVLRSSLSQSEIAGGIYKDEEKVLQPARATRSSRRKTSVLKVVPTDEKFDTVPVVENFETSKHVSKPCSVENGNPTMKTNARRSRRNVSNYKSLEVIYESGGDSISQQKNEVNKQKRSPIPKGDVKNSNNDPSSAIQSMTESSRSQKTSPTDAIESVAAKRKPRSSLKERHSSDTSSCEGLLENGESLFVDCQLAVSETISNPVLISNSSANNIISEVGLTSSKKRLRKKQHSSISDSSGTVDTKLINANELVNLEETSESRTAELKMDIDCRKEVSDSKLGDMEKVKSSLECECDVHEDTEETISGTDKSETEALVLNQTEDLNYHNKIDTKVLSEGSNIHGNAGFAETSSSADGVLLGHQIDSKNVLDVTEDEGDEHILRGLHAINHVGKVDGVFVQKNLDSVEPGHTNEIILQIACDHKDEISEQNNEDTVLKAGEADAKSELQLKKTSAGKLRKSLEVDKIDGDRTTDSELADTDEGGWLKDHKSTDEDSGFNLCYLFDGERSARTIPQQRRFFSGEYSVMDSDEQGISKDSSALSPTPTCPNSSKVELKLGFEADHIAKTDESQLGNSIQPESAETDESQSSKDQKRSDEDEEFGVYNLFVEDRVVSSDENVIKDSDEQEIFHDSPTVAHIHSSEIPDHKASQIAEGEETSGHKNINPELAESSEGGCLQDQKSSKDEDWEFNISDLFDSGKIARMMPRGRGMFSAEYSIKGSNEQGMFHDFPAISTMSPKSTEVHFGAVSSNLMERVPSEPNSVSKSGGSVPTTFDVCDIPENEDSDQEKEATNSQSKMPRDKMSVERTVRDEEHECFNQDDDHTNTETHEPVVQPKSSVLTPIAIANTIHGEEAWSGGSETAGNDMSRLRTNDKGKASEMVEGDEVSRDEMSMWRTIRDEQENFNQIDEHTNRDTYEPAEQSKSPLFTPNAIAKTIQGQETWSGGSETAGDAMSISKANDRGKAGEMIEGSDNLQDAISTMSLKSTEVHFGAVSSNLMERVPSEPNSVSKSGGSVPTTFDVCDIPENEDTDQEKEATNSQSKMPRDEMSVERTVRDEEHECFNQGDDHNNTETHEPAVQPKSSVSTPTATANTIYGQEAWSGESETAGYDMSILRTNDKGKASEMVEGDEVSRDEMSMSRTIRYEEHENFNHGDEHTNRATYEPAEQPKSPISTPPAIAKTIQGQETWSGGRETAGNAMSISKTNDKGKASEMIEDSDNLQNAIDPNCGRDKEDFDDARISDIAISMEYSKVMDENNSTDLLVTGMVPDESEEPTDAESSQSWTEIELNNLFGTTEDDVVPTEIIDNSSQGTEIANPTMSMNKSTANSGDSLIKKKKKDMEGERGDEKITDKYVFLAMNHKEVSDTAPNVGGEVFAENELKLLFATPIKVLATCNDVETSAGDRTLENADHCKFGEKIGEVSSEFENSLCLGNSCPDNGEDIPEGELKEVQNVELVHHSEARYDRCKAIEDQWTENTCEGVRNTDFSTEDSKEENFSLGQLFLDDEATRDGNESMEKDISSAGSMSSLDKVGGCHDMNVDLLGEQSCGSEGEMAQRPDVGADFQKSNAPENIHLLTACYEDVNITREVSIDSYDGPVDPEIAKTGSLSGQKDVVLDKGTPSGNDDELTEWKHEESIIKDDDSYSVKVWDNTNDNLRSSHEILDELLTSREVDNVVPPAEHVSSVDGAESAAFNCTGTHLLLGDNGGDDIEKSEAETSFFNSEEKTVNLNNHVSAVLDDPVSGCNEILKESDVEDTIKEYIDSESSKSVEFEESKHIEERSNNLNTAQGEPAEDIDGILSTSESKDHTDTESKEQEVKSLAHVDLVVDEGSSADINEKQLVVETEGKELEEAKKISRTILIHATPRKLLTTADMKENVPRNKNSHIGDFTTMRPAKRRALQDVHWK